MKIKSLVLIIFLLVSCASVDTDAFVEEVKNKVSEKSSTSSDRLIAQAENHCADLEEGENNRGGDFEEISIKYFCSEFSETFVKNNYILKDAYELCLYDGPGWRTFSYDEDDWNSLYLDGEGNESSGMEITHIACVLFAIDTPDPTISRIDSTNSLMGQQEATFNGLNLLWTYHPDNGLDIYIELVEKNS